MTDKQNFEKDINVLSKRLDRIDKMEIDLANYEQMERDIEKIIEPYQLDWELDCLSLPSAIQSILERKEQECEAYKMEADEGKEINAELKAENGYLKHKIFRYEEIFKHSADMIKNPVTAIEVETFKSGVMALGNSLIAEENNKLHKTLTEIKEIAENAIKNVSDRCIETTPMYGVHKQILQKIRECEAE